MKRGVLVSTSATIRRLFARSELPVSVTSTIASASLGGLTSVAPQLNSTRAVTPPRAPVRGFLGGGGAAALGPRDARVAQLGRLALGAPPTNPTPGGHAALGQ